MSPLPPDRSSRPSIVGADSGPQPPFPLRLTGKVIKGFGRGSKETWEDLQGCFQDHLSSPSHHLGIPTANIPAESLNVGGYDDIESGVYYGWAGLSIAAAPTSLGTGTEDSSMKGAHREGITTTKSKHASEHIVDVVENAVYGDTTDSGSKLYHHHDRDNLTQVHPMVMSIGWNLYYKNPFRTVEVHIIHDFEGHDFYDAHMNLVILGFIRPELDYVSKEKLIEDIRTDIDVAGRSLARPAYAIYKKDEYLRAFEEAEVR